MIIKFNGIKKICIFHLHKTTVENLTKMASLSQPNPTPLLWIKGYLFDMQETESEELTIQKTKGVWYIDSFTYAKTQQQLKLTTLENYAIEVLDMTGHPALQKIIESLEVSK